MSLDVWFKDDIRNTLLALNETSRDTHARLAALAADPSAAHEYRSGYGDALRAVAVAFGIATPQTSEPEPVGAGHRFSFPTDKRTETGSPSMRRAQRRETR